MPKSLANVVVHAVFSTKNRTPFLEDIAIRQEVHAYIGGVSKKLDCPIMAVGGVANHVHVLAQLGRTIAIEDWIKEIKRVSSRFAGDRVEGFAWQAGYGVFSVDRSTLDSVAAYVREQEEHHRQVSFQDEFRRILTEHAIEWDERYVWD